MLRQPLHTLLALSALVGLLGGCAFGEIRWDDPLQREISLEDAQHRYTVLVRWRNFEKAAAFVDPALRDAFLASVPKYRELRFTEYESEPIEIDEGKATATVEVTYFAYVPTSPIETKVRETQVWYRDGSVGNTWLVRPSFNDIDELLVSSSAGN